MWCLLCVLLVCIFFFKQKTAYEMRISDWSSDVCSSDLVRRGWHERAFRRSVTSARLSAGPGEGHDRRGDWQAEAALRVGAGPTGRGEIGRASCRERVCQYV